MAKVKKREADVYVVVRNGIPSDSVYTSLKDACGDAGVSYQITVRQKRKDWKCKNGDRVLIHKCSIVRIEGRKYNRCGKKRAALLRG